MEGSRSVFSYPLLFRSSLQDESQIFDPFLVFVPALHRVNPRRIDRAVSQQIRQSHDVLIHAVVLTREQMAQPKGLEKRYTFSGASLLEHLRECGLDSDDRDTIQKRVRLAGAQDLFAHI